MTLALVFCAVRRNRILEGLGLLLAVARVLGVDCFAPLLAYRRSIIMVVLSSYSI